MENGTSFLKEKYDLHHSGEVESAAKRTETREKLKNESLVQGAKEGPLLSEKVSQKPADRIQNYLDRFTEILDRTDEGRREHGIGALKELLHQRFVIKPKAVPESTFLLEQRIARELGHGDVEITDEFRERKTQEVTSNQTESLDKWVDYLSSEDAVYPDWAKYWALRSVLEMGKLEKEESEDGKETARFQKRDRETVASFPPLNPRALAMAIGVLRSRLDEKDKPKKERQPVANTSAKLDDREFQALLSTENFSKLYAQFLIEMPEYSAEGLQDTRGQWVKYERGSDAHPLVDSLDGHPLEWCTANYDTAQTQLEAGDFYVYYSLDSSGQPVVPRVAIRMQEGGIAEVRGIAAGQNLDPYIGGVVQEKMREFPDGAMYEKKAADMRQLTTVEAKARKGQSLSKDDLTFLYEIDSPIEGFGYQKDPRIAELRDQRNQEADMLVVFDYTPEQIAKVPSEITESTRAYVGALEPGIFQALPENLEHVYTSFPEKKIKREELEVGGRTAEQLLAELARVHVNVSGYAEHTAKSQDFRKSLLENPEETDPAKYVFKKPEKLGLIRLTVADLGFNRNATIEQIYARATELGLELCPPDVGPHYRLKYQNQPMGECIYIGMKQIADSLGDPFVFELLRDGDGLWLDGRWATPGDEWGPRNEFVFCLRKSEA